MIGWARLGFGADDESQINLFMRSLIGSLTSRGVGQQWYKSPNSIFENIYLEQERCCLTLNAI